MIPAFLIPIIVQLGSKLIDHAFSETGKKPAHTQQGVWDKLYAKDKKAYKKMGGTRDD